MDGKLHFIGCESWKRSDPANSHRFLSIPITIREDLVLELFKEGGCFKTAPTDLMTDAGKCAFVTLPRNGGKGNRCCREYFCKLNSVTGAWADELNSAYSHVLKGQVVQGKLVRRLCHTRIKIYSPIDRLDRRAIVILQGAHNHPTPPSTKLSRNGRDRYREAAKAVGTTGLTVVKCDTGMDI
jgi:hypothetical protein